MRSVLQIVVVYSRSALFLMVLKRKSGKRAKQHQVRFGCYVRTIKVFLKWFNTTPRIRYVVYVDAFWFLWPYRKNSYQFYQLLLVSIAVSLFLPYRE